MSDPIPDGWSTRQFEELIVHVLGGTWGKPPENDSDDLVDVRVIRGTEYRNWEHEKGASAAHRRIKPSSLKKRRLEAGDLVIEISGGGPTQPVGRVLRIDEEAIRQAAPLPLVCANFCRQVRLSEEVTPEFVEYFLRDAYNRGWLDQFQKQTTNIRNLSFPRFANETVVPIPSQEQQRRIVEKVDALMERSARAKEVLDAIPPLLERFRQSVLAAAFRGDLTADWRAQNRDVEPADQLLERIRTERRRRWEEDYLAKQRAKGKEPKSDKWKSKYKPAPPLDWPDLPRLPESWAWAVLDLVRAPDADICYGIVQPGREVEGGVPYIRGKDIQDGQILADQLRHTSRKIAERYQRAELAGGDVLLGIIRATKVAVVPPELAGANITQGTVRIRPGSALTTQYLAAALDSPWTQASLHSMYRGIDMPGLNVRDVRRLPIPIPPLPEQEQIERELAGIWKVYRRLQAAALSALRRSEQLDASILARAFRGEL